ncbi:hypothetical protein MRB53_002246 [Persea americana]|uniref:Uncharacterized protein n=1 Tax=Persea americana TaxID=3435 RepID=A0ACC2MUA2_PERAE|nr:hypothetical protein MRB53_002246 [Persea americana]|eukprot:TRINITY_DN9779_c0_g1_i1.p1 TRINITY_DN9779_c0_g1~~TRINITY_DN9779_c0_g1_i1.p1  ORF type:complete len:803 (-),score=213.40 TRINITY_DN9779_c0_g1_i1:377-2785(-)
MGKSGGRRKKGGGGGGDSSLSANNTNTNNKTATDSAPNGAVDLDSSIFLKRAHELKEEGNRRFQSKDYAGALEQYDLALKLTPKTHPERAVFHSNRAACLMQMKPVDFDAVVSECSLALQVQPRFGRALLRRARAFEALGKCEMAMQDAQALLVSDPNHRDALDIARRLRTALGIKQEAQQDLQSRPSPAALGASAVRGAPMVGLGPGLPARPVQKKATAMPLMPHPHNKLEKQISLPHESQPVVASNGPSLKVPPPAALNPFKASYAEANLSTDKDNKDFLSSSSSLRSLPVQAPKVTRWRPLKLVYDHDIRLAQMPANCSFRVLRELVSKRFPSSKSVLIKYKDMDGDLVTITGTGELRLAEACNDQSLEKEVKEGSDMDKSNALAVLRLHIVEVIPEQEPPLVEDEDEKLAQDLAIEDEGIKGVESGSHSSGGESMLEGMDGEIVKTGPVEEVPKEKNGDGSNNHTESKEVEIDDWLFDFAQLFRTHVGIDPDAHVDLHELGMELCSEALEETVTCEEAQGLFDLAASKFQEVAALAFFNWGNVHMCAARKRIPLDELAPKEVMAVQLQVAYDWVHDKYSLAGQKYEEALRVKPDFYEGLLALGQQHFETAKLHWSFAVANKLDLATWDSTDTFHLFNSAEENMKTATEMWEKLEEQRANELKDPGATKKDDLLKRRKKQTVDTDGQSSGNGQGEVSADEAAEQAAAMRSQIHLFWGNMLFERSQVEFKLGMDGWKKHLDAAVERFKLAGASEADISVVLKNHSSNVAGVEGVEKCTTSASSEVGETNGNAELKCVPER